MKHLSRSLRSRLRLYADACETEAFLKDDPSSFMHRVEGSVNQEVTAFVTSCLSYGSRKQFMPKVEQLLRWADGDMLRWVQERHFEACVPDDDHCFYRLYTCRTFRRYLSVLAGLLDRYGSLGGFVEQAVKTRKDGQTDVERALESLADVFWSQGLTGIVPRPGSSLCKRPVMYLRWMVRSGSPVDLGLWDGLLDRGHLLIPMDTHVMQTARKLRLVTTRTASWNTVRSLSALMDEAFPGDPARGDFALYGAGINPEMLENPVD